MENVQSSKDAKSTHSPPSSSSLPYGLLAIRPLSILNKLTPEKYDLLQCQRIASGITSIEILVVVVSLIYDKAVSLEPTFCPMYAQLCSDLNQMLPSYSLEEAGEITFKRLILNKCQEAKLLGPDNQSCPEEENVEAICQFLNTIGKQLDENPRSRPFNDVYMSRLKKLSTLDQLAPHLRFMVCDIHNLRTNNWVPRSEEDKKCEFFRWIDEQGKENSDLRFQILEKETTIAKMEYEKSLMVDKIKKLQLEKDNLEKDPQEIKFELSQLRIEVLKTSRNEKNLIMALFVLCPLFAILLLYLK